MASDGKVVFEIQGDPKGINTTLKDVTNNIQKESKKWDDAAEKSSDDMTKSFSKAFDVERVKNWAIQGVKALVKFGEAAISAASDLAEVQNVVDVTFGDGARQIEAWAQSAGKQYGLTELQAKKYTSTIGAMVKSQGLAGDQIIGMSENLAGLAADMASFYNLDFDTAFQKIQSGISGETQPLKQLGINMSVANLEAFALEQGITKSFNAMSSGEQTLLRYQYLMKATADAQGDFARTSDGFANATRRVQTAWENIKAKAGGFLMEVIEPLTSGISDFLDTLTIAPERTVLDEFSDIDKDMSTKMERISATYNKATNLVSVLEELHAKQVQIASGSSLDFETLFGDISKVESSGGDIKEYISNFGLDVDYVVQEYKVWKETLGQLTQAVPSLTNVIDAQTYAINGGTAAIQENLTEWKNAEEQKLRLSAYYAKRRALEEKRGELYQYEFDAMATRAEAKSVYDTLNTQWSRELVYDSNGNIDYAASKTQVQRNKRADKTGLLGMSYDNVIGLLDLWQELERKADAAESEYGRQSAAFAGAEKTIEAGLKYLQELYPDLAIEAEDAGDAAVTGAQKTADAIEQTKTAASFAVQSLAEYAQSVRDATAQAVDGIIKGFEKIERPTTEMFLKRSQLIQQQNDLNRATKDGEKRYQELQTQIDELNRSMDQYTPKGMKDALESQIAFMEEYISNLEKAREMGLSDELLAYLSDGSVQSAEYLAGLVADPESAKEVDRLYGVAQEYKDSFTDVLTDQKLAFDSTYDSMVETAKTAIGELDMEDEARSAMESTMNGLVQGIEDHAGDVENAVATILNMLSRLSSVGGVTVGASSNGHLLDGEHETGLDYVPFDGYLAGLHEGEGILTAEENRIWQRFKNGASPQSMDYDALGATMRENVQAGGNVYLDGRTVGRVISEQQGNAYRNLQRSGWQG